MTHPFPRAAPDPHTAAAAQADPLLSEYLRHLLLCLKRYVARHAHRMMQANGTLSDLYVSFAEAAALLGAQSPPTSIDPVVRRLGWPSVEEVQREVLTHDMLLEQICEDVDPAAPLPEHASPVESLRRLFRLNERQVRLLVAAAAPSLSVDLSRLFAFAWADFGLKRPWVGFLAELLADSPDAVTDILVEFRGDSPLVHFRLLELTDVPAWGPNTPLLHKAVQAPDRIAAYLLGQDEPLSTRIADTSRLTLPDQALALEGVMLPEDTIGELLVALRQALSNPRGRPRLLMFGGDGVGRATVLRSIVAPHGYGVLEVDLARLMAEGPRFEDGLIEVCREALLRRCLLLIRAAHLGADRNQFLEVARPLSRVLEPYEGLMAVSVNVRMPLWHHYLTDLFEVGLPLPTAAQQRELWIRAVSEAHCRVDDETPALLTQRFSVSPGTIYRAVDEARARAALFLGSHEPPTLRVADLGQAIRRKTVHALGTIAEPFSTSLTWDDVVLPDDVNTVLREVLSQARHREKVFDKWGFAKKVTYGRGLSCLFSGPPGTGKTMMAAVLAQTLGRELYRVDLSRVVSKWVGETEKNLSIAFDEAERGQLVLLFDEADALFSKRTSGKNNTANDRFANMEINYLLQRMEAFEGMTILTTNKDKGIDEAFKRRLKFKVHFPMPEPPLRTKLWASMIPDGVKTESDLPFEWLGKEFEMAGANIKNAVVRAAFYAAEADDVITGALLYKAALQEAREMGMVVREETEE